MSYHHHRGSVPVSRRSASGSSGVYSSGSSSSSGRPRSLGLYGNHANGLLSSAYGGSSSALNSYGLGQSPTYSSVGYGSGSPKYAHAGSLSLSSSPLSTYGGTTSGYGGLTLSAYGGPSGSYGSASRHGGYGASSPRSSYGAGSPRNSLAGASYQVASRSSAAALPARSSSFNTKALRSAHALSPASSALSSRSNSCVSLASSSRSGSEGYASGGDWSGTSRLSNSPGGDSQLDSQNYGSNSSRSSKEVNENGEIDYKKLYEASVVENERLRDKLKKTEDDLVEARNQIDKHPVASSKNSLSEMEKRERRAMERKLSEMEEELKQLQKLKAENERLKAENRALTRVVSKITNSAHATK